MPAPSSDARRERFASSLRLLLLLELSCRRWFPVHVLYLTVFTSVMAP